MGLLEVVGNAGQGDDVLPGSVLDGVPDAHGIPGGQALLLAGVGQLEIPGADVLGGDLEGAVLVPGYGQVEGVVSPAVDGGHAAGVVLELDVFLHLLGDVFGVVGHDELECFVVVGYGHGASFLDGLVGVCGAWTGIGVGSLR